MNSNLSPLKQAFLAIEDLQAKLDAAEQAGASNNAPIAVIGIGCRLPGGANDPAVFWANLKNGVDAIREVPPERWDVNAVYDPDPDAPGKSYVRQAGFLDQVDRFDPLFFGIAPREAHSMDPQQRLLLEVAWEALENAAIAPDSLNGTRTGVFLGIASFDYASLYTKTNDPARLDAYYGSGVSHSIASGRLSYILGLQGPSISIDTACSSSLVATHLAVQSLRSGDSDLALAAGVNLILLPDNQISFSKQRMLSSDGRCKTFDARADGFGDGEGCGVVVLKRLSDALAGGDRILAVIRGSALNQDGASSGLTAPNGPAQEKVIRAALKNGGVRPDEVGYVEAHGTGTSLGDPIEARALGNVLKEGRPVNRPFYLGSVKTNVGHLEAAAGITGLIKTILTVQHGEIPPHLNFSEPNPLIAWDEIPAVIPTAPAPWPEGYARRVAGVSAFGFSGTNAHIVLEAPPAPISAKDEPARNAERPLHLLALSARDENALHDLAGRYQAVLRDPTLSASLADVAYTANTGRAKHPARLVVTAADAGQAAELLAAFSHNEDAAGLLRGDAAGGDPPRIAFLFTGQGAQYAGMGRQLYETQPAFRTALERCDQILRPILGESLLDILYSSTASEAGRRIDQTAITQPALFAIEYALARMWMSWGITPTAVMGHSLGEYVAAVLAGVFSLEDGLKLIAARGRLMGALPAGGSMAAIYAPVDKVVAAIDQVPGAAARVSIAAVNGPDSTVLSGETDAVEELLAGFAQAGIKSKKLNVSHAFHSPLIEPMLAEFERAAAEISYANPKIRLVSDVTGEFARGTEVSNPRYWTEHVRRPVQFMRSVETLYQAGYDIFLEVGPNPTLTGMGQRVLAEPDREITWVSTLKVNQDDWSQTLTGLGKLFTAGAAVDWAAFDRPYPRKKLALPTYPFQRARYWADFTTGRHTGQPLSDSRLWSSVHPLLGRKLRSPAKARTYQNELSAESFSYLNDHRLFGNAILPGAAFIELGLAAGSDLFAGEPFLIQDLTIHTALGTADGEDLSLQTVVTPNEDGSARIEVYSQAAESETWTLHASAALLKKDPHPAPEQQPLAEIQARCAETIRADAHYQNLAERGLDFGESLKGVKTLWRRDGEALGEIYLTEAVASETGYQLHPALIDAHLQAIAAAVPVGRDVYLPIHFETIERVGSAAPLWSHVTMKPSANLETMQAEVTLLDETGQLAGRIGGVTLKRADRASLLTGAKDPYAEWLYEVSWLPISPAAQPGQNRITMDQLADQLDPTLARLYQENGLDEYVSDLVPEFDRLARVYIANAFLKLGWRPAVGQRFSADELSEQLGIIPQHRRLTGALLRILGEDGFVAAAGEAWEVLRAPSFEDAGTLHANLLRLFPQYEGELEITGRCGAQLAEAISGKADPLQLLFPGGSLETAEKIYQKSPAALAYNGLVRAAVESFLSERSTADGKLRVLEIGAGTGGTTSFVLPVLPATNAEYTFTDISPLFAARAREKFRAFPFVSYQTLDIEQDPGGQGLSGRQFDLIIAANVIHATQDLRATLRHVRQLLSPDGAFILLEVTAPQRWVDITFGLTDGWWRFTDKDLRPAYPLLSRPGWVDLLRSACFAEAATVPQVRATDDRVIMEEAVIIARAPSGEAAALPAEGGWLVTGDLRSGLADDLAARLRAAGQTVCMNGGDADTLPAVLKDCAPLQGVLFLGEPSDPTEPGGQPISGGTLRALLALTQALAASTTQPPRLWIITCGAQPAGNLLAVEPEQTQLWGFGKVVALEHPELRCTRVDLDPADPQPGETLLAELGRREAAAEEDEIAVRDKMRFAPRLTRLAPGRPAINAGMKTLAQAQPGILDTLAWEAAEMPQPGPGEVQIRVQASGLNFKDVMMALGMVPGVTGPLGAECAGVVTAVGEGVTAFKVGDPVMTIAPGSFNTYIVTRADFAARIPAELTVDQAASNLIPFITAAYALNHVGRMKAGETVLIHAGAGGVGLAAIQLAQRCGAEIFATAGSQEKRATLSSLGVQHVLDSRSLSFADEIMRITAGRGVDLVLNSLAGEFIPKSLSVTASGGRFLEIGKSGLLTAEQAAAQYPGIHYTVIDWTEQTRTEPDRIAGLVREIAADLAAGALRPLPVRAFSADETVEAFRFMQQARHTGRIVVRQPADDRLPLVRPDASYLVTGGLRGLGLLTAGWLAEQGACHLALLGRSEPTPAALQTLRALEDKGVQVLVLQGDVTVEADLRRALDQIRETMPPLRGIIHSAGQLNDAALINQTWERFETVLGPKVTGPALLHRLTQGLPLDFFVLFSSIASIFGSRGQANHAAANAYLDGLAHARRGQGLPALAIDWGVWAEVGAAVEHGAVERSAEQGLESFSPADGLKILARLMVSPAAQVMVSPTNWPVFLAAYGGRVPSLLRERAAEAAQTTAKISAQPSAGGQASKPASPNFVRELAAAPADRKRGLLLAFVQTQAGRVLGLDTRSVQEHTPLNEMGLDSLMAVELRNLLGKALDLKRPLPVTMVFDYPTTSAITDYLAREVLGLEAAPVPGEGTSEVKKTEASGEMLGSIEDLSDDEVDRLLAEMNRGTE